MQPTQMTEEEFNIKYREGLDTLLEKLADSPDVDVRKFYSMACILENLSFFGPVLFGLLQRKPEE